MIKVNNQGKDKCCHPAQNQAPADKSWAFNLPTQEELDHPPSPRLDQVMAFMTAMDDSFIHAALTAPHKMKEVMKNGSTFKLIWDSGASHCISNCLDDFIGPLESTGLLKQLTGLAQGLHIKGVGTVEWTVLDVNGVPRTLSVRAYYVPKSPVKLISTTQLLQTYPGETIQLDDRSATLSGIPDDHRRTPVKAFVNPINNIPDCSAFQLKEVEKAAMALHSMTVAVDPRNINLSEAEKELLRWHQRLGHLDFKKIQFLLRSGALCLSASKRTLHTQAAKLVNPPKCAACQFGKQTTRPAKGRPTSSHAVHDRSPVLKQDKLFPGQTTSVDHFVCSTKGVTLTSRGGANAPGYTGGCIMVDNASGLTHVEHQQHLNTHETLEAIKQYERMCLDRGVVPTDYISDSGTAFTSKAFQAHLANYQQIIQFAGTAAHNHNSIAERSIRTIMSIARTMMLHAATHWPEMADATLWPLAVDYAVHIFNRVPNRETGLSPLDVFTGTREPLRRLHDLHVWGSPSYLLDKRIADGKQLPRWSPKSERVVFVGVSDKHLASTPRVLNPRTRTITTPYHLVFDDWFATVGSSPEDLPDFQSPEWRRMFGDSEYQYVQDESWNDPAPHHHAGPEIVQRRERVAERLTQQYSQPLRDAQPASAAHDAAAHQPVQQRENTWDWDTTPSFAPPPTDTAATPLTPPPTDNAVAPLTTTWDWDATPDATPSFTPVPFTPVIPDTPFKVTSTPSKVDRELARLSSHNGTGTTEMPSLGPRRTRNQTQRFVEGNTVTCGDISYQFNPAHVYMMIGETMPTDVYKASKSDPDTMTLEQALADTVHSDQWVAALEKEIRALEEHEVWEEVPASQAEGDIVPTMFVMKIKRKPDGTLDKFKARITVRGDLMKSYGFETFSAVCAWSTVRMVLILALTWGWTTCTVDFSNAFIHAKLDTPVWIQLPKGYTSSLPGKSCLKLKRSLYGTSFAPALWSECLFEALKKYGLKQSQHDTCLFSKPGVMAAVYVDDLVLAFKDPAEKDNFFSAMKDLGFSLTMEDTIESFLGIKFEPHPDGSFVMTQPALIQKIIDATDMNNCNAVDTPALPNQPLGKDPDGEPMTDAWSMHSVTGMLLYLSTNTRPDICFAVSQVCRFNHGPKQSHAQAVKRIVRYLAGTKDKGSIVRPDGTLSLDCSSDSDFAGLYQVDPMEDLSSAKSRMGFIIKLGGCPLVWKSQLIPSICLATAEAEYYSLSHCLRVLLPIRRTLEELAINLDMPTELRATITSRALVDNSAALSLATNQRLTSRTRYYHTQSHHFWEAVNSDPPQVIPEHCSTLLMDADYFTKPMPRVGFEANRKRVQGW
jgi:hypothetical protein